MNRGFDPRITPARPDLAAAGLEGRVEAARFVAPESYQVARDGVALRFAPSPEAELESQLLFGEVFDVYENKDGYCWGQNESDGYVGYVEADALSDEVSAASHVVSVACTYRYAAPDLKSLVRGPIGLGGRVAVVDEAKGYCRLHNGDWLFQRHLEPVASREPDYIATGMKLIGCPYLWGGRSTAYGLDCSTFVQHCLARAGIAAPRDADLQEQALGAPLENGLDLAAIRDGDLLFFPGHVGFVVDSWRFLHANAFDMCVSMHSMSAVLDRAKAAGENPRAIRRLAEAVDYSAA